MASKQERKPKTPNPIHIAKFEEMVTPSDTRTTLRLANFLNPLSENPHHHQQKAPNFLPKTPLLSEIFSPQLHQWPSSVIFRGTYSFLKKWKQWVDQLTPKYSSIWIQAGIHQAILTSVYEIRSNPDTILGLSEFWCPQSSTFIFPWGEATISLEDIMILGGYPVLGDPVTDGSPVLPEKLAKLEEKFKDYRLKIKRKKGIKATHHGWLNLFMEEKKESRGDLVHIAFLCIWLSRFVFPSIADKCILNSLIPIAVKLSQGVKLALGPAVLASIYHNLTILREEALASRDKINVSGPFHLLQIWAFERFPVLGPKPADLKLPGLPRMARWDKLSLKLTLPLVRLTVKEAKNFCWRPYAAKLENWDFPSYYKEKEQSFSDCSSLDDEELRSFHRFLLVSEVVGLDCKEKYFPHRVAMQFGFDQDIPAHLSTISLGSREPVQLFVPSRSFQHCVTLGYSNWWKGLMLARQDKFKDVSLGKNRDMKNSDQASSSVQASENTQDNHAADAALNPFDPELESSKDSNIHNVPPKVSPKVPSKDKARANDGNAIREDCNEAVATDLPTSPTTFKGSSSTIPPPPGFHRLPSDVKKRLGDNEVHEPPLLPCARKTKVAESGKEQLPISIQANGSKAGIPVVNLVKQEYPSDDDDDDDVVIISHLVKESSLREARKPLKNAASSSPTGFGRESDRKEKSSMPESLEVFETPKNFNQSSEVNAGETVEPVKRPFHREIKVEAGNSANEPLYVGFDVKIERDSSKEHRASVAKGGERKKAGESARNPINLDDEDTACASVETHKNNEDVEKRLQKLEKMMGLLQE